MTGGIFDGFRVVGFDLETTGFDIKKERIVEYALIGSDIDGTEINLQSLVNPQRTYLLRLQMFTELEIRM